MQSWQDRGEVADSDEDDSGVETLHGQERPTKRLKLEGPSCSAIDQVASCQHDLQPDQRAGIEGDERHSQYSLDSKDDCSNTPESQGQSCLDPTTLPTSSKSGQADTTILGLHDIVIDASRAAENLHDAEDIVATPKQPLSDGPGEQFSSPLTELEDTPPPEPWTFEPGCQNVDQRLLANSSSRPASQRESDIFETAYESGLATVRERTFRKRKNIQLHPYLVDRVTYQRQFKERGLKPIRLIDDSVPLRTDPSNRTAIESQDDDFEPPSSNSVGPGDTSVFDNPYNHLSSPLRPAPEEPTQPLTSNHKLPRLERRQYPRKLIPVMQTSTVPVDIDDLQAADPSSDEACSMPPSPSSLGNNRSRSNHIPVHGSSPPKFRPPRGMTPVPLPTPQISSEPKVALNDHSSSPPVRSSIPMSRAKRDRVVVVSPASSESESYDKPDAEVDSQIFRQHQKRIKGVLPASWARLDLQAQRAKVLPAAVGAPHHEPSATPLPGTQKGVARRLNSGRLASELSRSPDIVSHISISDDADTSSDTSRSGSPTLRQSFLDFSEPQKFRMPRSITHDYDDDVMENDWIDPMFAGRASSKRNPNRRTRQRAIDEVFSKKATKEQDFSEEHLAKPRRSENSVPQSRTRLGAGRQARTLNRNSSTVRLSVLDAPKSQEDLPRFLKIALRQARKRPDGARHSPDHKYLRLSTAKDTAEVSTILRSWRQGEIRQRPLGRRPVSPVRDYARLPLGDLPLNRPNPNDSTLERTNESTSKSSSIPGKRQKRFQTRIQFPTPRLLEDQRQQNDELAKIVRVSRSSINSPPKTHIRNAHFEASETEFNDSYRHIAFERRIQQLGRLAKSRMLQGKADPHLMQFLEPQSVSRPDRTSAPGASPGHITHVADEEVGTSRPTRRRWKAQAHRLDAESRELRQPNEMQQDTTSSPPVYDQNYETDPNVLQGLSPFGHDYSRLGFDTRPIDIGTFFHSSTFIGSGELADALTVTRRNLDICGERIVLRTDDKVFEWTAWSASFAEQLSHVANAITSALQGADPQPRSEALEQETGPSIEKIQYLLRTIACYLARGLYFVDPIDRIGCANDFHLFLTKMRDLISERLENPGYHTQAIVCILQYSLVISYEISQICEHHSVPPETRASLKASATVYSDILASCVVTRGLEILQQWYESNRRRVDRESGIRSDSWPLSSLVILNHVTQRSKGGFTNMWASLTRALDDGINQNNTVGQFEAIWHKIFTVIPPLEIDSSGIARVGSRLTEPQGDWDLVNRLTARTLHLYQTSSHLVGKAVDGYVRTILSRCYVLVQHWGWLRCDQILGVIYDFFASRNLALLLNEEGRGSPRFLENLHQNPSLEIQPDDSSFTIFLKMLGSAIKNFQSHRVYNDRKVAAIVWRFVPNHGRTFQKELDLQISELESLRNHHNLLCTLYYASPAGHRPRLRLLVDLVDHSSSHREACRLSIRSWTNIAAFQASTKEPVERLIPLAEWYTDIMKKTVAQFRFAKLQVEQDCEFALQQHNNTISDSVREGLISRNQRQIAATIVDALVGLRHAISTCTSLAGVQTLANGASFWVVFDLFDPSHDRTTSIQLEALELIQSTLDLQQRFTPVPKSQSLEEDSQDFGDSSALQEFITADLVDGHPEKDFADKFYEPLYHFLSNVLGADTAADDHLVRTTVNVWVNVAHFLVKTGEKRWASFVDEYSTNGWKELRDTAQKRKFTPYFLSRVMDHAQDDEGIKQSVLKSWVLSLIDREAMLSYQHLLTSALLNYCPDEPMVQNLPFAMNTRSGKYDISMEVFSQRRLGLISSLLSNMQAHYDEISLRSASTAADVRITYAGLLRELMQGMKTNYRDLESTSNLNVAASNVQGAYVTFVQHIVSLLQQYSTNICPVDRFFTDSAAFPLPATDPTYVVGRLRSYVSKLSESKTRKQLTVFILSVSERAAADDQQQYLVNQIALAVEDGHEPGNVQCPTLRHVLCAAIFPAYIKWAFANPCAWILLDPILLACQRILGKLLHNVQWKQNSSITIAAETALMILSAINSQIQKASQQPLSLERPEILQTLTQMVQVAQQTLTFGRYLEQAVDGQVQVAQALKASHALLTAIAASAFDASVEGLHNINPSTPILEDPLSCWPDTLTFADSQLRDTLEKNWYTHADQIFLRRGSSSIEISARCDDYDEERQRFATTVMEFRRAYGMVFGVHKGSSEKLVGSERARASGLEDVVV